MYRSIVQNVSRLILGTLVAFLVVTQGCVNTSVKPDPAPQVNQDDISKQDSTSKRGVPPANHPSNESPGGPGWDEVNNVPKSTHTRIAEGCIYKSEMVFYITDERLYNGGNVQKMEKFMLDNMSQAEYRIKIKLFKYLHEWVDAFVVREENLKWSAEEFPVHEVTWAFFNECMQNSYASMSLKPTPLTQYYMQGFGTILGEALEGAVPIDT